MRYENEIVIITGAASGVGRATAIRLAAEGARVAALDIDATGLEETASRISQASGVINTRVCDMSIEADILAAVAWCIAEIGKPTALCNCAGLCLYSVSEECDSSMWDKIIATNLTGPFILSRAILPYLVEAKGAIVNVASMAGLLGMPYCAAYSASKGGLVMMTKALAKEFSDRNVRVNVVCPGAIATPMMTITLPEKANTAVLGLVPDTPAGASTPEEVAATIAMLGSRECRTLTGCVMTIDGGST